MGTNTWDATIPGSHSTHPATTCWSFRTKLLSFASDSWATSLPPKPPFGNASCHPRASSSSVLAETVPDRIVFSSFFFHGVRLVLTGLGPNWTERQVGQQGHIEVHRKRMEAVVYTFRLVQPPVLWHFN